MKRLSNIITCLIACLLCCLYTNAATESPEYDYGEIQIGETYKMKDECVYHATFTATKDGYLHVYSTTTNTLRPFKEWCGTTVATMAKQDNGFNLLRLSLGNSSTYNYEFPVKAGDTFYFCGRTFKGEDVDVTFKLEEKKTIEFLSASVDEGEIVSPSEVSSIIFNFNRPVVIASAVIVYGDGMEESVTAGTLSTCGISVGIRDVLVKLSTNGLINEGETFELKIKGVQEDPSDITDGSAPIVYGDVSVRLKVGELPAMLQSATIDGVPVTANTKFLTYYAPGTGVLTLTFTKKLDSKYGEGLIRFGDSDQADNGGYYQEYNAEHRNGKDGNFTLKVEGNQVIIDFSGKRRAVSDMVSSTESNRGVDFTTINLEISKVTDTDGNRAYTTSSKTAGRFNYSFKIDVPEANVSSDFTPGNGSSIKNVDNIEIWITDEQSLTYDGVKFAYLDENGTEQEIIVRDYTREEDEEEEDAIILTVPVPEAMKTTNNVVVSLNNVSCVDGKDYSNVVAAKYNVVETGISGINANSSISERAFSLNGQAVNKNALGTSKSIIISGGKKVIAE